jgi:hypothetical protein
MLFISVCRRTCNRYWDGAKWFVLCPKILGGLLGVSPCPHSLQIRRRFPILYITQISLTTWQGQGKLLKLYFNAKYICKYFFVVHGLFLDRSICRYTRQGFLNEFFSQSKIFSQQNSVVRQGISCTRW